MKPPAIDYLFEQIIFHNSEEAFRRLFFDFFGPLCVFAHRYIPEKAICEDIVQNVFFQLWKNRKKINITTSARNYLITNVRNACIDSLRRKELERNYIEKQGSKSEADTYDIVALLSVSEMEEKINTALSKLPDNVRHSFELSRFEDKTYNEIATAMGISVKTVEAHIGKALKLLREELKDYLPFLLLFLWQPPGH